MGSSVTKAKHDERILNPLAMAVRLTLVDCDIAIFIVSYNHHRDRDQVVSLLTPDIAPKSPQEIFWIYS